MIPRRVIGGVRVSNLFDQPGKPTGWAHHAERDAIRDHLNRKYGYLAPHTWEWTVRELGLVARIQHRLHRYDKSYRELQALYASARPAPVDNRFTREELKRLVELFEAANDPVTASIARKAAAQLV